MKQYLDHWVGEAGFGTLARGARRSVADALQYALKHPSCELDLRALDVEALNGIAEPLMKEVAQSLSALQPAVVHLMLPPRLHALPPWLPAFGNIESLSVGDFQGNCAEAAISVGAMLPSLRTLDLTPAHPAKDLKSQLSTWTIHGGGDGIGFAARIQVARILKSASRHPGNTLDLREAPAAMLMSNDCAAMMKALALERRSAGAPGFRQLLLPAHMPLVPGWIGEFADLDTLSMPKFDGALLDLRQWPQIPLKEVDVSNFTNASLTAHCGEGTKIRKEALDGPHVQFDYDRINGDLLAQRHVPQIMVNHLTAFTDAPDTQIVCASLGTWLLREWRTDPMAHTKLVYKDDVPRHVTYDIVELGRGVQERLRDNYVVEYARFGNFIDGMFEEMQRSKVGEIGLCMVTVDHFLNGRLRIVDKDPGLVFDFYDVNRNGELLTLDRKRSDSFADCTFLSLLDSWQIARYLDNANGRDTTVRVTVWPDAREPIPDVAPRDRMLSLEFAGDPAGWHPNLLHASAMKHTFPLLAPQVVDCVKSGRLSREDANALFTTSITVPSYPTLGRKGIFAWCVLDSRDFVGGNAMACGNLLLDLRRLGVLSAAELAKSLRGAVPWLHGARELARTPQTIKVFGELMCQAFLGRDSQGAPLLTNDQLRRLWLSPKMDDPISREYSERLQKLGAIPREEKCVIS